MLYDREDSDSDWNYFDDVKLGAFLLLGVVVGFSVAFAVFG